LTEISRRWKYGKRGRGRPGRRTILYVDFLKSIVLIAGKYDLDPKLLIEALVEAWSNDTSQLESLKITCREVNQDSATLLITNGEEVVSQFPIRLEVLKNPEYVKDQIQYFPPPHYVRRKLGQKQMKIGELRYGMRKIDVKAKIIEIPPVRQVLTRFGTTAYVSNVKIADGTGSMRLSLWNDQIYKVHVGDEVELKACHVAKYKGESQLRLGRIGTISVVNDDDR